MTKCPVKIVDERITKEGDPKYEKGCHIVTVRCDTCQKGMTFITPSQSAVHIYDVDQLTKEWKEIWEKKNHQMNPANRPVCIPE
jgi:hypothetical protein